MPPSPSEPFLLWDESLSSSVVPDISAAIGRPIATVWDEWPERDLSSNPVPDQKIIPHLGGKSGHLAFWITQDWSALGDHKLLISIHQISVLWLRGPGGRSLKRPEQSMLTIAVIERALHLALETHSHVYLRARYDPEDGITPILERLQGSLRYAPLQWERVPLN